MPDLMQHFGAWHPGPHYHGTEAELNPGDLIEPNKHPPSHPDDPADPKPREHTYFSPRKNYVTEHYGPNVYEVEPQGEYTRDPEYNSRTMFRSKHPLRVVKKVTKEWGLPHEALLEHFGAYHFPHLTYYHGTPDVRTWDQGAKGIHVGSREAARQALNARIGKPHEGEWDGTREYGKTLLSPYQSTGAERGGDAPRYPTGAATYAGGVKVPMDARPHIFPVRITGQMTNTPATPHEDFKANGYMAGALKRGNAKSGYFYRNVSEDEGSISAVVPSAGHLERLDEPKTAGLMAHFADWYQHMATMNIDTPARISGAWTGWASRGLAGQGWQVAGAFDAPALANPYHGSKEFGGNPEFSSTWFHGTTGRDHPDLSSGQAGRAAPRRGQLLAAAEQDAGHPLHPAALGRAQVRARRLRE